ncbi:MAG: carboxypeptidase regulatory-like domain-containing protein [Ignavibacteriaceae bacterium]|nr:carboxypeptidase regulatory-like domain-containing protein [Ignavibacteriaceae bacterium]
MKLTLFVVFLSLCTIFPQNIDSEYFRENGEIYFKFQVFSHEELNDLTQIISIDGFDKGTVTAYANELGYKQLTGRGYRIELLPHPGDEFVTMTSSIVGISEWDSYPTFDTYLNMMNNFATDYPSMCSIYNAGSSVLNRQILFAVVNAPGSQGYKPKVLYSATIHGDETTGYILTLRLIHHLLTNYGIDPLVTYLMDNLEIWINPLANPDGTYRTGNHTVTGARRSNNNGIDINRNFPDPVMGEHPDGASWQPETLTMMNLSSNRTFVLSGNFHGGAEVVNYPWDSRSARHADNTYFVNISRMYADTVHFYSPGTSYMRGFENGITNGWDWYSVYGGRQDYFTYFRQGREITFEISNVKLLNASLLPAHWNYNKNALLNYLKCALYGIKGEVKGAGGEPVKAEIRITGHDIHNSQIYSDSLTGGYMRVAAPGNYNITFSAAGYVSQTINGVSVTPHSTTTLNIELQPEVVPVNLVSFTAERNGNVVEINWITASENNNAGFEIERVYGNSSETLGFIKGQGNSISYNHYKFVDHNPVSHKCGYRIKQVDFNGSYEYSQTIEIEPVQEFSFVLNQNYPNPVLISNGVVQTSIRFKTGLSGEVSLRVYDILGNLIDEPVNGFLEAGNHLINLNCEKFTSGVYFCELKSANFVSKIKMLFIK